MSWTNLKAAIAAAIKTNNNQEITGAILQNILNSIVNSVGANATFAGVATPSTSPGTPDGPVFWLVGQAGQYSNFNNTTVPDGTLGVFVFDGSTWTFSIVTEMTSSALVGYYTCGASQNKASETIKTVDNAYDYTIPANGGSMKIKMYQANTATGTVKLQFGNTTAKNLYYNGLAVSPTNTWEANEVISVYYDPSANSNAGAYYASNAQGGGGKAEKIKYDNSQSGLASQNVQGALDELYQDSSRMKVVDLSRYNEAQVNSTSSNVWGNTYKGKFLPVNAGEVYNFIAQLTIGFSIIPLQRCEFKYNTSYSNNIAGGYSSRISVLAGKALNNFVVPNDCTTIYISTTGGNGNIEPTVVKVGHVSRLDDYPKPMSVTGVTSDGVFRYISHLCSIKYYSDIQNIFLDSNMQWSVVNGRQMRLYSLNGGELIHLKANPNLASIFAFISDTGTMAGGSQPTMTSARFSVLAGQELDIVAPEGTNYMVVYKTSESGDHLPSEIGVIEKTEYKYAETFTLDGRGSTSSLQYINLKQGVKYKLTLDSVDWQVSSISSGVTIFQVVLEGINVEKAVKGGHPKREYFFKPSSNQILTIAMRGDVGVSVKLDIEEAEEGFNKLIHDVAFVESGGVKKSFMVKVNAGELIRYSSYSQTSFDVLCLYSRCIESNSFLVDKVTASGVAEGEYIPKTDVFAVVTSGTSTAPSFKVYGYGEMDDKMLMPSQIMLDTDNIVNIISSTDADATQYDNKLINKANILQYGNKYYMWYHGMGTSLVPYLCMALSDDGLHWERGVPEGTTPWYPNTNVVIGHGTIVGTFSNECINEYDVFMVNDSEYPFRMIANIRNAATNTIPGEKMWLFKSADGVSWQKMKIITEHAHDNYPTAIVHGDIIKIYLRMWDYTQSADNQRMIGVFYIDMNGNTIVPPSGIFGRGLYNAGASKIGNNRDLLMPTHYYPSESDTNAYEAYIVEGDKFYSCPTFNLASLKKSSDNDGWGYTFGLVNIGTQQYVLYTQRPTKHFDTLVRSDMRLCPIEWITYDTYNTSGDVG